MTVKQFLAATMLLMACHQAAHAQQKTNSVSVQQQPTAATTRPGVTRPAKIDIRNDYQPLKKEPQNLPDMPQFTGNKKFMSGYQSDKNGLKISARYHTNAAQQDVLNFYRQTLKQYGWKFTGKQDAHNLAATNKNGNSCVIQVMASNDPSMPTEYFLSYSMK